MKILITGATGFVGRVLVQRLLRDGFRVIAAVRDQVKARSNLGQDVELVDIGSDLLLSQAVEAVDGIVNLAGEPIFGERWTAKRKADLVASRVELTQRLSRIIESVQNPAKVFVSASAIGFYGDAGDSLLDEQSNPGTDFLAKLCQDWESAAGCIDGTRTRVAILRIGMVVGSGGALEKMLPAFRLALGGRLGSGKQWVSWIHVDDLVEMIVTALLNENYRGVYNATAPQPVTNTTLTKVLAQVIERPALFPVPGFALRLVLGGPEVVLLASQRVLPRKVLELGFKFIHSSLEGALRRTLDNRGVVIRRQPKGWRLEQSTFVDRPLDEVFAFFSKPENLGLLTPSWLNFEILNIPKEVLKAGDSIAYRIGLGPFKMGWISKIDSWQNGERFTDIQIKGPYKKWHHEHRFVSNGTRTKMTDVVDYDVPAGFIGRIVHLFCVGPSLRSIFRYRGEVVERRFSTKTPTKLEQVA